LASSRLLVVEAALLEDAARDDEERREREREERERELERDADERRLGNVQARVSRPTTARRA
jgi:hypothetical protein